MPDQTREPREFDAPSPPVTGDMVTFEHVSLPPEGPYTEAETQFIQNEPDILPSNQDSIYGQVRRVVTDILQQFLAWRQMLWNNMVPQTADVFLGQWEYEVGLPPDPTAKTLAQRRAAVLTRFQRGAFTRPKRDSVIAAFISADVHGDPARFSPEGIDFTGGIPFYNEWVDLDTAFNVYEYVENFTYRVRVGSGYLTDSVSLERELLRLTPAGISFDIVDDKTVPVVLRELMVHLGPQAFWAMGAPSGSTSTDEILNRTPGTFVGGYTATNRVLSLADPSISSPLFGGVNGTVHIPHMLWLDVGENFTIVALVYPTEARDQTFWSMGNGAPQLQLLTDGTFQAVKENFVVTRATIPGVVPINQISLLGYSHRADGGPGDLWVNGGIDLSGVTFNDAPFVIPGTDAYIASREGATEWFKGNVGFVAIFNRILTPAEWDRIQQTRLDLFA